MSFFAQFIVPYRWEIRSTPLEGHTICSLAPKVQRHRNLDAKSEAFEETPPSVVLSKTHALIRKIKQVKQLLINRIGL